ncbi:NTP pyrophosphohydrolase [Leucobacter weissii]|uniref:NTP pyrophosphohydrolase n=1 Tax=Leucobacter weissii TaxID=1983706 RepID=A0A939S5W1_9MICO|nr:NTP pyrophosphohydrolase [Leucobacter weissii]MBO1901734.1 NTP pyrophosphohydrolase [Leucobacter weissii]
MSAATVGSPALADPASPPEARGCIRVHERVIEKVVREASASAVGIPRRDAEVQVAEWSGGLAVRIAARLPIPDLGDTEAIRTETPILERIRGVQGALAEDLARLTGRRISRVSVTVTGAVAPERKRVR